MIMKNPTTDLDNSVSQANANLTTASSGEAQPPLDHLGEVAMESAKPLRSYPPADGSADSSKTLEKSHTWLVTVSTIAILAASAALLFTYWIYAKDGRNERELTRVTDGLVAEVGRFQAALSQESVAMESINTWLQQQQQAINAIPSTLEEAIAPIQQAMTEQNNNIQTNLAAQELRLREIEQRQDYAQNLLNNLPSQKALWQMMEVVQLQRSALKRIRLDRDLTSARAALEMANQIMRGINVPNQSSFITHSNEVLQELGEIDEPSPEMINLGVAKVIRHMELLPLRSVQSSMLSELAPVSDGHGGTGQSEARQASSANLVERPWYQLLWRDIFSELQKLVRFVPDAEPLLPPDAEYYLRENLKLSAMTMRFALHSHDVDLLHSEKDRLAHWIRQYAKPGAEMDNLLSEINTLNLHSTEKAEFTLQKLLAESEAALLVLSPVGKQ